MQSEWINFLINNRVIIFMPMTNPHGYAHSKREELNIDPNRDFPYLNKPNQCLKTITARVVNSIFR